MPSVSYRHRFGRSGLDPAVNDGGVELGTWESEGLDVSFGTSRGSQAAVQSVTAGEDEFGNSEISAILKQIQNGASLTILGQVIDAMSGVVSLSETGITEWQDLEGKTVGTYPFGVSGNLARVALAERGGDPEKVNWRNMQPGSATKLVRQGTVDAAVTYFPQLEVRLGKANTNVLILTDVIQYLGPALFTRDEIVENRPEMVNSFVRGWLKAHEKFVTDLDEVIAATAAHQPEFDETAARKTLGPIYASRVPPRDIGTEYGKGWTPEDELEQTQAVFAETGILPETRALETYYTNRFIERNEDLAVETATLYYDELSENFEVGPNYV